MQARARTRARLKWYGLIFCVLIIANTCISVVAGGPRVRHLGSSTEFATDGLAILVLWTKGGKESIAWDSLPGALPRFDIAERRVFVVVPLWIPLLPVVCLTGFLFWVDRQHAKQEDSAASRSQPDLAESSER